MAITESLDDFRCEFNSKVTLRLHATAVWECVVFVLTGLTFIFIGLQLREVVSLIATEEQLFWNTFGAVVVLIVTILVRMIWIFPAAWIPRRLQGCFRLNANA